MRHDMNKRKVSSINDKSCGQKKEERRKQRKGTRSSLKTKSWPRTNSHFGLHKKFSCEIRIGIKSTTGQSKRQEARERGRGKQKETEKWEKGGETDWQRRKTHKSLTDQGTKCLMICGCFVSLCKYEYSRYKTLSPPQPGYKLYINDIKGLHWPHSSLNSYVLCAL